MSKRGIVLLAHGARDPAWAVPFEAVAARVRERAPEAVVRLAFLELMAPPLADAGAELAGLGCTRVDVVPVFLGGGGHVRRDVPAQLARLRETHAEVVWTLHDALGETPHVIAALADAAIDLAGLGFAAGHHPLDGLAT
ncbi:sirohydrochlorin chelatase [Scleromatobacter humisilvae]|uniref:CbiX/SirB N-terminal domain-containing protein n=1 Tax=Scleromatobacter humisilvae TaxID=2897159 RepID=A0A9X1YH97_9BURK|nr:CbiX/SirB N-terminal domain-containing protein [Scleromatobacter humisilvae]MCK9686078.1 CbiX/SirB N-terminal domain-containing protein [Scleromatobacter humisilvae]